jgi:hypothetical protein
MADGGLSGLAQQSHQRDDPDSTEMYLLNQALAPILSEARSGADRLRPPYPAPLRGLEPVAAGAARDVEVGYSGLPGVYQSALQAAPERQTQVGTFPSGYAKSGETAPAGDRGPGSPAYLVGTDAQVMLHELVHELQQRAGDPNPRDVQEAIARLVAGDTDLGGPADDPMTRAQAANQDAKFRARGGRPEQPMGGLEYLMWMLKAYDPMNPRPTK